MNRATDGLDVLPALLNSGFLDALHQLIADTVS